MRSHITTAAWPLLMLALVVPACDDSTSVAPEGSSIILAASPSNIVNVDANGEGESAIMATVLNVSGIPQDGVAVFFSTNAGTLDSGGQAEETDGNGIARDRLRTTQSAQITAQSGSASAEVTVSVAGQPPVVGNVNLQADGSTTVSSGGTVAFSVSVFDTFGVAIENQQVTITTPVGGGIVDISRNNTGGVLLTDAFGIAVFDLRNITINGTEVVANAGGQSSQTVTITVVP